jgi:hypothetical protein
MLRISATDPAREVQVNQPAAKAIGFVPNRRIGLIETIGSFTEALEATLVAPTRSALEANPQDWQTNSDWDLRLDLEV